MNNLFKKIGSFILAGAIVLSMSACSSQNTGDNNSVTTITYWHLNSETFGGPKVTELVEQFNQEHDDIIVKEKFIPGSYVGIMQEMQAAAVTKTIPDVVQIGWPYIEYFSNNFAYTTPQDLIDNYGENKEFLKENFGDAALGLTVNSSGEMAGFPYGLSTVALYVNPKFLDAANLTMDDVQTWPQIKEAAKKMKEATGKYGLYIAEWESLWETQQIIESNGANFLTDGVCTINSEGAVEAMQLYADMILEDKTAFHASYDEGLQSFLNEEIGMYYSSISDNEIVTSALGDDVSIVASPGWPDQERVSPAGGNLLAVTSDTDAEKLASLEFVEFMTSAYAMEEWTSAVGYIPHVSGVDKSKLHPNVEIASVVLDDLVPWYCFPGDESLSVEQILLSGRDKILNGSMKVEPALAEIEDEINKLYK